MAKPRRLKVYRAEIDGLHEWIVAAPNRPAALEAFGVHQDLFAQGNADEEDEPDKVKQAQAAPGVPLRRTKGSKDAFTPASDGADWSAASDAAGKSKRAKPKAPEPDRKAIGRAEAKVKATEADHRQTMDDIEAERAALDDREAAEGERYRTAIAQVREQLAKARKG